MRALKIKTAPAMSRSARAPATPSRRDGQGVALVHGGGMYHGDIGRPPPPRLRALLVRAADARAERGELAASRACGTRDMREPPASPRGKTACLSLSPARSAWPSDGPGWLPAGAQGPKVARHRRGLWAVLVAGWQPLRGRVAQGPAARRGLPSVYQRRDVHGGVAGGNAARLRTMVQRRGTRVLRAVEAWSVSRQRSAAAARGRRVLGLLR